MTFTYKLTGTGWAQGKLQIDEQILEFEVSYLGDPLKDLLEGLVKITPCYAGINLNNGISDNEVTFDWHGEPWGYKWILVFHSFDNLQIKVVSSKDIFDESEKGQISFEANCNYFDFVGALIDELTLLIKKHGLVGYYQTWAGESDFPVSAFLKLKHFKKTKSLLETKIIEPINPNQTDNCTQATNLEDELKLLTDK